MLLTEASWRFSNMIQSELKCIHFNDWCLFKRIAVCIFGGLTCLRTCDCRLPMQPLFHAYVSSAVWINVVGNYIYFVLAQQPQQMSSNTNLLFCNNDTSHSTIFHEAPPSPKKIPNEKLAINAEITATRQSWHLNVHESRLCVYYFEQGSV